MILDRLSRHALYRHLNPRLTVAFDALLSRNLIEASDGTYEIDGRNVFAIVQRYTTKPREQGRWEAHRRYADVQFVVSGIEMMGWTPVDELTVSTPYNDDKDIVFLDGNGPHQNVAVASGLMAVFFSSDAHMPGLANGQPSVVHKIVMKVRWTD
jgi:YhcH/YjgK/YiaL family protein